MKASEWNEVSGIGGLDERNGGLLLEVLLRFLLVENSVHVDDRAVTRDQLHALLLDELVAILPIVLGLVVERSAINRWIRRGTTRNSLQERLLGLLRLVLERADGACRPRAVQSAVRAAQEAAEVGKR